MAVVITSKFYQDSEWKDISKVVFTSPNMDSPSVAGTRSHILPGEGALGTWYEDTSQMFRIENHQWETETDFYNFSMYSKVAVDLATSPAYIDVINANYDGLPTYIKENSGVEISGYEDNTAFVSSVQTKLEYTPLQENLTEISTDSDVKLEEVITEEYGTCITDGSPSSHLSYKEYLVRNYGWYSPVIPEVSECYIRFEFTEPIKLAAVSIAAVEIETATDTYTFDSDTECSTIDAPSSTSSTTKYFVGAWKVEASADKETWTQVYSGSNSSNTTKFAYLTNNSYWQYYRLVFTSNTSLGTGFDKSYYGVRKVRFHTHAYSDQAGTETVAIYDFNSEDDVKILKLSNAQVREGEDYVDQVTSSTTNIEGSGIMTVVSGAPDYSSYDVSLKGQIDFQDYLTQATCISTTVNGEGIDGNATTYTKEDKIYAEGIGYASITPISGSPGFYTMEYSSYSEITDIKVDTIEWLGTAKIGYTTVASGTNTVSGVHDYDLTGDTTRTYTATVKAKRESYRLYIDEVVTPSGVIAEGSELRVWGYDNISRPLDMDTSNSVIFEITTGEAYNCRLTAWDDATHSTLANELIQGDHARVSAVAYNCSTSKLDPGLSKEPINYVYPPVHNRILKGDTVFAGNKLYYGDFDLVYRYQDNLYGDYLMFRPMLYGITSDISYGIHDFVITLHYSYT